MEKAEAASKIRICEFLFLEMFEVFEVFCLLYGCYASFLLLAWVLRRTNHHLKGV